jgi:8-oxo-dGTP pyrophosphatase MutT (NUDIX family)
MQTSTDSMIIRRKAFAYVTSGPRLLLFTHPEHPDAGIQVPAGTMAPGEVPAAAALREAREETGLTALRLGRWIGRDLFDARPYGRDEHHDRWFFHIVCDEAPERWRHWESDPADGGPPIPFAFFWADVREPLPELIAGHGRFIPELRETLGLR